MEALVEQFDAADGGAPVGRAEHQGPEVDGSTLLVGFSSVAVGQLVNARVTSAAGADLIAEPLGTVSP